MGFYLMNQDEMKFSHLKTGSRHDAHRHSAVRADERADPTHLNRFSGWSRRPAMQRN
jgi:hypothetical protein